MVNKSVSKVLGGFLGGMMALAAADAQVLSQSRARLQDLSFEIYDAVPNDGIDAQAWFMDETNAWRTHLYFEIYRDDDQSPFSYFAGNYESLIYQEPVAYAAHQVPVTPKVDFVGVYEPEGFGAAGGAWGSALPMVGAQGQSLAPGVSFSAYAGFSTVGTANLSPTFYNLVLGAGTGVRIGGYGMSEVWLSEAGAWATAYVELNARFSPRAGDGSFQPGLAEVRTDWIGTDIERTAYEFEEPHDTLVKRSDSRWMSVAHENLTEQQQIGRVRFSVSADGEALAPVPEPHAGALMLLGLPLLLVWRFRRGVHPGAA